MNLFSSGFEALRAFIGKLFVLRERALSYFVFEFKSLNLYHYIFNWTRVRSQCYCEAVSFILCIPWLWQQIAGNNPMFGKTTQITNRVKGIEVCVAPLHHCTPFIYIHKITYAFSSTCSAGLQNLFGFI